MEKGKSLPPLHSYTLFSVFMETKVFLESFQCAGLFVQILMLSRNVIYVSISEEVCGTTPCCKVAYEGEGGIRLTDFYDYQALPSTLT